MTTPPNDRLGWTERDDAIIVAEYRPGRAPYLAAMLGRSVTAVHKRAQKLGLTTRQRRLPDVRHQSAPSLPSPALVVELAEARMEADALRILLARAYRMLGDDEAGLALGVSADLPEPVNGRAVSAVSPLHLHAVEQAARGMDLASKRLGRGGVIGDMTAASLQAIRRGGWS